MDLSRRELLTASALALVSPKAAWSAAHADSRPIAADGAASAGTQPIVLCWNENPYGPSPAARAILSSTIPNACRYPDEEIEKLIAVLAQKENFPVDHIVVGTGSGELLCALGFLHGKGGGEIIAAEPTYAELTNYAKHAGAELKFVPVDKQLNHDLPAMRAAVSPRTRAVYICNPNNPTGTAISAAAIRSFVGSLPDAVTTIVDEAYLDFADTDGVQTVTDLVGAGKRVVVLRTFSKIHGMAGVRCGYAIARPDVAAQLAAVRMSTANIFAMRAARASLGDEAFLTDTRRRIIASRKRITDELQRLGRTYARSQTNFVFFDTGAPLAQFDHFMKTRNILVGRLFPPYNNWCRITIGTEPETAAFLQGLQAYTAKS
ncbi:MAG: histidinol-phosphate aminotransferase family protein [Proteobacteria bacterium]|nr:histidinol-phosphate aminotransferase family protein [Pseudomonadota bacterium]